MKPIGARSPAIDRPIDPDLTARFRASLQALGLTRRRLGVAVSGGPDSLALLLLARECFEGTLEAASVDHGLRPESAAETALVAQICARLGVPHAILPVVVARGNLQNAARQARYEALEAWRSDRGADAVATGHHADDQTETLLMRLNRGSGLPGLAGIRADTRMPGGEGRLVRPLLSFRKDELEALVSEAGLEPVRDPSNLDPRFDRARLRRELRDAGWMAPDKVARSAAHLAEAEEALAWTVQREWDERVAVTREEITYRPRGPRHIRWRVLARAIASLGEEPRGGQVGALLDELEDGGSGNVAGVLALVQGKAWKLRREPPRR